MLAYTPRASLTPDVTQAAYDIAHAGLLRMVYEESASIARHFTNMSVKVAGKTGTGEHGNGTPTAWFCAYAPADSPKYAVCCVIDKGGYGSTTSMFVVRDVLGALFGEPDTSTTEVTDSTR